MKQIPLRMTDEQGEKLERQAKEQGRSMNSYICNLIEQDSEIVRVPMIKSGTYEDYLKKFSLNDPRD